MNNDMYESDDDDLDGDYKSKNCSPFPDQCENEEIGIESLYKCLDQRYAACPYFFTGSLLDACNEAFNSDVIKERRPVLVYIHHDKSMFNNVFCYNIFCSTTIIDYLFENYIVWPWDITFESNRDRLIQNWDEIFNTQLVDVLSVEQCPMLIGIMRPSARKKRSLLTSEYEFKTLLKRGVLTRTNKESTRETLLQEFVIFKEEYDDNEQALSFDITNMNVLCFDIVLEIVKYLSLNDAVNAFSDNILPHLYQDKRKLHISEFSRAFINIILRKINPEQIVSLRFNTMQTCSEIMLPSLSIFTKIISLTLLNPQHIDEIIKYEQHFPNLTCLSLWYDNEVNFNILSSDLLQLRRPIRRFEIHCAGTVCTHNMYQLDKIYAKNVTIQYFLLNVGHFPLSSMTECFQNKILCFLTTTTNFIKNMRNIRYVRIITNKYNVGKVLNRNEWKNLMDECQNLKKITIEILQSTSSGEQFIQKAMEIQKAVHNPE